MFEICFSACFSGGKSLFATIGIKKVSVCKLYRHVLKGWGSVRRTLGGYMCPDIFSRGQSVFCVYRQQYSNDGVYNTIVGNETTDNSRFETYTKLYVSKTAILACFW